MEYFVIKDYKKYIKILFDGALPVFIAAIISQSICDLIDELIGSNDLTLVILLNFLYSLIFGYILGVTLMIYLKDNNDFNRYTQRLAIENAGFAWNNTLTLIILKRIYSKDYYIIAFFSWVICIFIVILIVYISNFVRLKYLNLMEETQKRLIEFDSESFALSITFSITIIIASAIYSNTSTNYLTGFDDLSPMYGDELYTKFAWVYIFYVLFITTIISIDKYYEITSSYLNNMINNNSSNCFKVISNYLFAWDTKNYSIKAYLHLFDTFKAYLVASAWYSWLILSFQNYFSFMNHGYIFGLLLFALLATYIVLWLLSRVFQLDKYNKLESSDKEVIQSELLLLSGRLIVGWTWQLFLVSCVGAMAPTNSNLYDWVKAIVKLILALIFFIAGAKLEIYLKQRRKNTEILENDSNRQTSDSKSNISTLDIDITPTNSKTNSLKTPLL